MCGGSINGLSPCADIRAVSAQWNRGKNETNATRIRSFYTSIANATWSKINGHGPGDTPGASRWNGCDAHYNERGHAVLMRSILPDVRRILGW